jgi:hypothetical protein
MVTLVTMSLLSVWVSTCLVCICVGHLGSADALALCGCLDPCVEAQSLSPSSRTTNISANSSGLSDTLYFENFYVEVGGTFEFCHTYKCNSKDTGP